MRMLEGAGQSRADLEALSEADFGAKLQQFDGNRIASRMKELAGSVSAMREIFGASGQADAPMAQIFNALEAITQNKLATMPAAQVESLVRRTKAVMETTGIGLDGLMAMTGQAAAFGDTLGLDRSFAATAGQNAALFGAGYKGAFGDYKAFGAMGVEEVQKRELMLNQRAVASDLSQNAGALIRTAEAMGGVGSDTRAGQLIQAIKSGQTTFEGKSLYDSLSASSISSILSESGMGAGGIAAFQQATRDRFGNQETISQYGIGDTVRRLQPVEVSRRIGGAAGESAILATLTANGMSPQEAMQIARKAGGGLLTALLESDDVEGLSTAAGRQKIIQKELAKTLGEDRAAEIAGAVATNFESSANQQFKKWGYGDMTKFLQSQNSTVLRGQDAARRGAYADAEIGQILSPLGKTGPLQRVMDMLSQGMRDTDIQTAVGTALGGVSVGSVRQLVNDQNELRGLLAKDPDKRTEMDDIRIRELRKGMRDAVEGITDKDIDVGRSVSDDDLRRAADGGDRLMTLANLDDSSMDPEARKAALVKQNRLQLTRANNLFSALAMDDASLRKLGPGGAKRIQALEQKYMQLMRLSGGDPDKLARALAGDPSIPESQRKEILAKHGALAGQMRQLQTDLAGEGNGSMTDEEFAKEKGDMEAFRAQRTAGDAEQAQGMLKKLGELTGIKELAEGKEVEGDLGKLLGGYNSETRRAIMIGLGARERLGKAAAAQGVKISELDKSKYAEDFANAGSLAELEQGAGIEEIGAALESFQPDEAAGQQQMAITIKEGTVKIIDEQTATFSAVGQGGI